MNSKEFYLGSNFTKYMGGLIKSIFIPQLRQATCKAMPKVQIVQLKPDWRESFCVVALRRESKTWTKSGCAGTEASLSLHFQNCLLRNATSARMQQAGSQRILKYHLAFFTCEHGNSD